MTPIMGLRFSCKGFRNLQRGSSVCPSHHLRRRDTQSEIEISVQVYTRNSLEDQNELRAISDQSTEGAAVECPAAADRAREAD
jgi:hypothetical protein